MPVHRVLLIIPPDSPDRKPSSFTLPGSPQPLSLMLAAALLEKAGHQVALIDGTLPDFSTAALRKQLEYLRPRYAVFTAETRHIREHLSLAAQIKKIIPDCTAVAVGAHVTAQPEECFREADRNSPESLDIIIRGEFEMPLLELCSGLRLNEIPGISWKSGNRISHNPEQLFTSLNDLPMPAWHLVNPSAYRSKTVRHPFLTLSSSRGCPQNCSFCRDVQVMEGQRVRQKDPGAVIAEILRLIALFPKTREFIFNDINFAASTGQAEKICESILESGVNRKISFGCQIRPDVENRLLRKMKQAGFRILTAGFESHSQDSLDLLEKGFSRQTAENFAQETRRLGFAVEGIFMLGLPGETEESARETLLWAETLNLTHARFLPFIPFPGTRIVRKMEEQILSELQTPGPVQAGSTRLLPVAKTEQLAAEAQRKADRKWRTRLRTFLNQYTFPGLSWL